MNLGNCPRCGKLYAVNFKDMCPSCIKEMEIEYEKCVKYLREEKGANIQQLSDATDVSIKQITRFVREGRISVLNAPNLMYPCEVCGTMIRDGHMCDSCRGRLTKELSQITKDESNRDNGTKQKVDGAYRVMDKYHK
ncbi:TIGR03826 family flagellar region protein [Paenibacillus pini]|uniref:Flagellar protein n=1 Tax=Paenibacillus pini JCM 16418 TaxID=1236976 RepID=W7Z8E1_9BACL|nr:TIGR03826 family flagellar region protein [Paenibacillus pini]GAF10684.1 flagellar protein [Paenibacillus pini JCM 16418]